MHALKMMTKAAAGVLLAASVAGASAFPGLQLTILGGTYVGGGDDTTYAGSTDFDLAALLKPSQSNSVTDTYYISIAVVPKTMPPGGNFGSFTINGTTVNVTSGMVYGVPPLEAMLDKDPGDLAQHGIFETYFYQYGFSFNPNLTTAAFDAQTTTPSSISDTDCNPNVGNNCLYYALFDIDTSGLTGGVALHFDLYNTKMASDTDIDINKFAPFSHDAQSTSTSSSGLASSSNVPTPGTSSLALLGLGLVAGSLVLRRKAAAT